ncbi:hypothetical protein ACF09L_11960 [Streptomyces sp. NPDC014779]|uniref:hypothetical protein n=1 Tax=Streptomyces sp. NPDC014779 TaxID=3364911 RepID=UPI0036F6AA1C
MVVGRAAASSFPRVRTSFNDADRIDSSLVASRRSTLLDSARPHRTVVVGA